MNSKDFVDALRKQYKQANNRALCIHLGLKYNQIDKWHSDPRELTIKQVCKTLEAARKSATTEAHHHSIRAIVEYYPVEPEESKRGASWELFDSEISGNKRQAGVKDALKKSYGVYVFYDSRGQALYVGKAKKQTLWDEMKSAFNRDRETQKIRTVSHPYTGNGFKPAYESPRKIELQHFELNDLALYFSAYDVDEEMIDNVEALLVRVYANGLLNAKMENFVRRT